MKNMCRSIMLEKNLDTKGRVLRFIIACVLLGFAWWYSSWILLIFAIFTFLESLLSWCIVYQLLGINECPINKR